MNNARLNLACYPAFITSKTRDNHPLFANHALCEIVVSCLYYGRSKKWFELLSFVVMPDHLHLIVIPREKNISQVMHSIKSYSSKEINRSLSREGPVWQSSFRDFTISTPVQLLQKAGYIHNNPVRKGLVSEAAEYRFSSANRSFETDLANVL